MPTVLIIDDEAMIRSLLRQVFQRVGFEVTEAGDGGEGLEKFAAAPADLVICDLIMPRVDGIEVITRIRRTAPATKIIAMSGGGRRHAVEILSVADDMGADHVIKKPFGVDEILKLAATCLGRAIGSSPNARPR